MGAQKQDCERNGARRWLNAHRERVAGLRPIYLGDSLFFCQPLAEAVPARGADFIFMCKPDGRKTLYEYLKCVELEEFTTIVRKPGKHTLTYHYSWINGVPLGDGKDALDVNWLAISLINDDGKTTYKGAFATSLEITRDNVEQVAACGRPRSKIENETFNALKITATTSPMLWRRKEIPCPDLCRHEPARLPRRLRLQGTALEKRARKKRQRNRTHSAVCTTGPQSCSSRTGKISLKSSHEEKLRRLPGLFRVRCNLAGRFKP
jgi:hypothetical protein